jgi:Flp pilus assembly protein protease CpaA
VVSTLAIALGITVSYAISIIMAIVYFGVFIVIIVKVRRVSNDLLKKTHFNLSLALRNENDRLYNRYGIKARTGFMSKWIEFHWANPYAPAIP